MNNYKITDLIELNILQEIQDAFSNLVGMAALITDADGNLITKPSNFNDYCACTQKSDIGCTKCTECHKESAKTSYEKGISISNVCFAGLSGYAAPIIVNNEIIGCFHGGQVLTKEPDEEEVRKIANEIGVNPDEYFKEIKKIKVVDKQQVDMAIQFLETFSKIFSDIAEGKNKTLLASEEIARAAKMKTDFLANMSHEIRTPMNAVIGMAEMALREDIPNTARDYIIQIKSSGRALLAIINDILDFSKIESGKMDIIPIEYDSMSMFNDVSNIAMTRLVDKDVELDLDITPDLPAMLFGDNIRIRQILINLTNNAVKFTKTGSIKIIVDFERQENSMGILKVAVKDTGIGIKKEDMQKIFESFQQVDSTRNREVEGTGLGLAICQNLLKLMNGSLHVESEYEKGSCFSFEIPQIIVDADAAMVVKEPKKSIAISMFSNKLLAESFARDSAKLGVKVVNLPKDMDLDELYTAIKNKNIDATLFFFIEKEKLTFKRKKFIREHPEIIAVLVTDFIAEARPSLSNMLIVKKPLSAMNLSMIYNREKISFAGSNNEDDDIDYTAPEAWALIVDDNAVNLTVAEGLLEPLKIKTATANSGKEALKKTLERRYDLIFMDHMMPEMDGIEATQKIRELREGYKDVPIIALTANAVGNAREMFLEAGLNDFIAKPIEVRTLLTKVKQWLPKDKIVMMSEEERKERLEERRNPEELIEENTEKETLEIDDLDIEGAIRLLGSEKLFWSVLKEYYRVIKSKTETIRKYYAEEDWPAYTIEVHALKSSSKQIGALELSAMALDLEMAGKENRIDFIKANTEKALEKYLSYEPIFAPYFEEAKEDAGNKPPISKDVLIDLFTKIKEALDDLDMDTAEGVCNELDKYSYPDNQNGYPKKLKSACDDIDVDQCLEIISDWEKVI